MKSASFILHAALAALLLGGFLVSYWKDFVGEWKQRSWFGVALLSVAAACLVVVVVKVLSDRAIRTPAAWQLVASAIGTGWMAYATVLRFRSFRKRSKKAWDLEEPYPESEKRKDLAQVAWCMVFVPIVWASLIVDLFAAG